jgi:nucleoside-diphosphate-sugar epimerase
MRSSVRTGIPALRRKRRLPPSPRTGSMCRWCDCRRFTIRSRRVSLPLQSGCINREKGVCTYVGDGRNRFPAAYVLDVARLYRLAIEKAEPNAKYHAVAEEGVAMRDIAEAIGRRLKLPVKSIAPDEAQAYFGWLSMFAGHDMPASSAQTRRKLGWEPKGPGLIADLERLQVSDR